MLDQLSWIPDAHSLRGHLWERVGHRLLPDCARLFLWPLSPSNEPNETASSGDVSIPKLGSHYRVGSISHFPVPSQAGHCPRLPTGYFEPSLKTQSSVNSVAVIDQTEEGEEGEESETFQRIVFFQYTVSVNHGAKSRGLEEFARCSGRRIHICFPMRITRFPASGVDGTGGSSGSFPRILRVPSNTQDSRARAWAVKSRSGFSRTSTSLSLDYGFLITRQLLYVGRP
jgi:hypothetical protein